MICDKIASEAVKKSHPKGVLRDKKGGRSKYSFNNPERKTYYVIDFEKNIFGKNDPKCDFGLKTDSKVFFIELKGCEVKKGISQLLETIQETEKCFKGLEIKARLIISSFPGPNHIKTSKEYIALIKKLNHNKDKDDKLIIKKDLITENI